MKRYHNSTLLPGELDVICGPMKSGKSIEVMTLLGKLIYISNIKILAIKPDIDDRGIFSRSMLNKEKITFKYIDINNFDLIESFYKNDYYDVMIIDECQFFNINIVNQIDYLLRKNVYIICAGLDLDFRGETFGPMGELLSRANNITKLTAICEFKNCNKKATRTQKEINGKPAPYNSNLILVGDEEEGYSCRCLEHHTIIKN